jgi:GTPase
MFVDELTIYAKAGKGGDGVVRWRHQKNKAFGGPSGGDGGKGGSIYVRAVPDVHLLARYRTKKEFLAERGWDGESKSMHGADGTDLEILLPIGSVITNKKSGEKISLHKEGERILILKGGRGGRGNESFKNSKNQRPEQCTPGKPGQEAQLFIEVELIAQIGLIGLPNAGKTSLLNTLTHAKGKIGAYPFTTLEPNLGNCYGSIIADIPGLIEGAAQGKGLGHKFLRHIRRTNILAHVISLENKDVLKAYNIFRNELAQFDSALLEKREIIVLNKTDLIDDKKYIKDIVKIMKKVAPLVTTVSIHDTASIKALQLLLLKEAKKAP